MFPIFFLLFTLVPAIEIYLLFTVGSSIGGLNTFALIIITGIIGASLAKSQGLSIINRIQAEAQTGGIPGDAIVQAVMIFAGGLLLLTPGFLTDIFGLLLVMPGSRQLLAFYVKRVLMKLIANGNINVQGFHFQSGTPGTDNPFSEEPRGFSTEYTPEVENDVFEAEYSKKE